MTGTGQRAHNPARSHDGAEVTTPPPGVPPAELGALVVPAARYQQATATLLDLAARGHLQIALRTAPQHQDGTAWWTLTRTTGDDDLRDYEQTLLHELGETTTVEFPNLTNHSVDRIARRLHQHHHPRTTESAGAALQRGIARHPDQVDAQWFAHAVALDVSPPLTRSLTTRHVPTPSWATTHCDG